MQTLEHLDILFEARKNKLFYYSPYSFLRSISEDLLFRKTVKEILLDKIHSNNINVISIITKDQTFLFLVE